MKKLLCLLVVISALCASLCVNAEAAESGVGAFEITNFRYVDSANAPVTALSSGAEIHVKADLTKKSGTFEKTTLIVCLLKDGNMVNMFADTKTFANVGATATLDAKATLPAIAAADLPKYSLESYLWHGWTEMQPLGSFSTFGSANPEIKCLYVNGEQVEDFDPSGAVPAYVKLPITARLNNVDISALCADLGTSFTEAFTADENDLHKGTYTLTAKSHNGTEKTYILNLEITRPEITNISFYRTDDTVLNENYQPVIGKTLTGKPLVFDTDDNGEEIPTDFTIDQVYPIYTNYNTFTASEKVCILTNVPDDMIGSTQILTRNSDLTRVNDKLEMTFTTNKSVKIFFRGDNEGTNPDYHVNGVGYSSASLGQMYGRRYTVADGMTLNLKPGSGSAIDSSDSNTTADLRFNENIRTATINVTPGETATITVELDRISQNVGAPGVFFKFVDDIE